MAVAAACWAFYEFVDLAVHVLYLLYLLVFTKACAGTPEGISKVENTKTATIREYLVNVSCNGETKQGKLSEKIPEGKEPQFQLYRQENLRFDGEKCFSIKIILKKMVRAAGLLR